MCEIKKSVGRPTIGERAKTQTELHRDCVHNNNLVRLPYVHRNIRDQMKKIAKRSGITLKDLLTETLEKSIGENST